MIMTGRAILLAYLATIVFSTILRAAEPNTKPTALTSGPATRPATGVEDDVFEAVFRYQFEHNASGQQQKAAVYYLALSLPVRGKNDPDDAFMKRFARHQPPVRKVSERKVSGANPGLIFNIETIKWASGRAEVQGGYYEGGLSAAGSVYTVEKVDGKWKVTAEKREWIA